MHSNPLNACLVAAASPPPLLSVAKLTRVCRSPAPCHTHTSDGRREGASKYSVGNHLCSAVGKAADNSSQRGKEELHASYSLTAGTELTPNFSFSFGLSVMSTSATLIAGRASCAQPPWVGCRGWEQIPAVCCKWEPASCMPSTRHAAGSVKTQTGRLTHGA